MRKYSLLVVLFLSLVFVTGRVTADDFTVPVIKIYVSNAGKIFLNGEESSLPDVQKKFQELKKKKGEILFCRDPAQADLSEQASEVINLVVKNGLPITFSTRPVSGDNADSNAKPQLVK